VLRVGTSFEKQETVDSNVDDESSNTKMRFRKTVMLLLLDILTCCHRTRIEGESSSTQIVVSERSSEK
jgi:hypothetical protein